MLYLNVVSARALFKASNRVKRRFKKGDFGDGIMTTLHISQETMDNIDSLIIWLSTVMSVSALSQTGFGFNVFFMIAPQMLKSPKL